MEVTSPTSPPLPVLTGEAEPRVRDWGWDASDPTGRRLSVTYSLTTQDMQAFTRFTMKKPNSRLARTLIFASLLVVALALLTSVSNPTAGHSPLLFSGLLASLLPFVFFVVLLLIVMLGPQRFKQMRKTNPYAFAVRTVILDPEFFGFSSEDEAGRSRWRVIKQVDETPAHLFVIFPNNTGHVVPKSAFARPEEAATFAAAAQEFWRAAHPGRA